MKILIGLVLSLCLWSGMTAQASDQATWETQRKAAEARSALIATQMTACSEDTAISVTFDELFDPDPSRLASNPKYDAKCVSFDAQAHWRRIIRDEFSRYKRTQVQRNRTDTTLRQHIGMAGHELMQSHDLTKSPKSGKITGVLSDCQSLFLPMGGYCHYESGPFLFLVDLDSGPLNTMTRLIGNEAAWRYGNLSKVDLTSSFAPHVEAYFDSWLNAISRRFESDFSGVKSQLNSVNDSYMQWDDYVAASGRDDIKLPYYRGLYDAFFGTDTVYQNANLLTGERRYFIRSLPQPKDHTEIYYVSCVCLTEDCDGRWPISTADVFVSKDLPYLCQSHWLKDNQWKSNLPQSEWKTGLIELDLAPSP